MQNRGLIINWHSRFFGLLKFVMCFDYVCIIRQEFMAINEGCLDFIKGVQEQSVTVLSVTAQGLGFQIWGKSCSNNKYIYGDYVDFCSTAVNLRHKQATYLVQRPPASKLP